MMRNKDTLVIGNVKSRSTEQMLSNLNNPKDCRLVFTNNYLSVDSTADLLAKLYNLNDYCLDNNCEVYKLPGSDEDYYKWKTVFEDADLKTIHYVNESVKVVDSILLIPGAVKSQCVPLIITPMGLRNLSLHDDITCIISTHPPLPYYRDKGEFGDIFKKCCDSVEREHYVYKSTLIGEIIMENNKYLSHWLFSNPNNTKRRMNGINYVSLGPNNFTYI